MMRFENLAHSAWERGEDTIHFQRKPNRSGESQLHSRSLACGGARPAIFQRLRELMRGLVR